MKKILIENGNVILPDKILKTNILIENHTIKKISKNIKKENCKIINAENKYIFPGAIDPHVHLELNLGEHRISSDDFESGTNAALHGGVTTLFSFAHQEKDNETLLQAYKRRKKAAKKSKNRVFFHSGIMRLDNNIEKQIEDVFKNGVTSFKLYMNSVSTSSELIYRSFSKISELGGKAIVHCEDAGIVEFLKNKLHKEKKRETHHIPFSRPEFMEYYSISNVAMLAEYTGVDLYIVHLSTGKGAKYIEKLQNKGIKINAETCPQYLLLTEDIYKQKDGYLYTCTPPFRKKSDTEILWEMLKKENIKFIATDHCPFMKKQKNKFKRSFIKYVYGIPGVEFSPVLMISEMRKRKFDFPQISRLISTNASKYFGLYPEVGIIKEKSKADLFIYNPKIKDRISYKKWKMNCDFNHFENWPVNGKIETVIFNGKIVENNNV